MAVETDREVVDTEANKAVVTVEARAAMVAEVSSSSRLSST